MSLADKYFIENCRDIIEHGSWDTNSEVKHTEGSAHPHIP